MKRRPTSDEPLEEASINLTPLIDVVFVVLIMFIVVAPLLDVDRINLASSSPLSESAGAQEKCAVTLALYPDNSLLFNQEFISMKELAKRLKEAKRAHPKGAIQFYPDRDASFGAYQSVKNAVEAAGFDELLIVLKP